MRLKAAYSTGEAARICSLSQTTIIRLFDSGVIVGYRTPVSKFRRIPHADLDRFLTEHSLPNPLAGTTPPPAPADDQWENAREVDSTLQSQAKTIVATASRIVELFQDVRRDGE